MRAEDTERKLLHKIQLADTTSPFVRCPFPETQQLSSEWEQ
jgi:hypothetical protein